MKVYNTLSGQKEEFQPQGDRVKMYVCGITPYDECHIGHAMSYVIFDVLRRYLEFRGYKVHHVQNFTDVDDKIIARANHLGITSRELAERFIAQYFADMERLNVQQAHIYPRATQEIPKIIEIIQGLIKNEHAYQVNQDVYFRVKSFPTYGKLSHRVLDEMEPSSTSEERGKEHHLDFALWKAAKPGEPSWESPWGKGRPGWHIECSAMSLKYLGTTLDIHGGGQDLIFPHHENEIAQSECFTGTAPFVRYWLHNGLVQLGEEKMSKSTGKLVTVKEALSRHSPDALRLFILSSHYRSPLNYSEEGLGAAQRGVERLCQAAKEQTRGEGSQQGQPLETEAYRQRFLEAMDDDFNTAQALGVLFDLARDINRAREQGIDIAPAQNVLKELSTVLGLTLKEEPKESLAPEPLVELLISVRGELRRAGQWQIADNIRALLKELNIVLEDTPRGTQWKVRRRGGEDD